MRIIVTLMIAGMLWSTTTAPAHADQAPNTTSKVGYVTPAPVDKYITLAGRIPASVRAAFERIGHCESTGNIRANTGNGFYGWLQFTKGTWNHVAGLPGYPHLASKAKQLWGGWKVARIQGWGAWPVCAPKAGATRINIFRAKLTRKPH